MNAINTLKKIYNKGVKEGNKRGFADKFKLAMRTFEKTLKKDIKVTFDKVEYLDGYFIFGMGNNSVVHFKLKDTPGWKYGIWWSIPKKYYDKDTKKMTLPKYVNGSFFAQYEENIDKFKPSASTICCDFTIVPGDSHSYLFEIAQNIKFIINEPYLAFCRDACYNDYNHEYLSRRKAKKIYKDWRKKEDTTKRLRRVLDNKFIKFVKKLFEEEFNNDNMIIIDRGQHCSPRYELYARQSYYSELDEGCYDLFTDEDENIKNKWVKKISQLEKIASKHNVFWWRPFNSVLYIMPDKKYNCLKKYSK